MKIGLNSSYKKIGKLALVMMTVSVMLALFMLNMAFAGDKTGSAGKVGANCLENTGFMKDPPVELKEKFPMCDAFMNVEWIDEKKKIGYVEYEILSRGKKKKVWELISMTGDHLFLGWDIYQYQRRGQLQKLFEMIRNGKVKQKPLTMTINYQSRSETIHGRSFEDNESLADQKCNVCVPYPDKQKAWIAEGKTVKQTYTAAQRNALYSKLKVLDKNSIDWVDTLWVLDINYDGQDDYVLQSTFAATWSGKLFLGDSVYKYEKGAFQITFPPNGRKCYVKGHILPLITDGKNYYIDDQCNLTELTTQSGKE